jgi:error-prone DNA polymerase
MRDYYDLLGLGMMALIEDCQELIPEHYGEKIDLAHLPQDDEVYRTLQKNRYGWDVPD